VKTEKVQSCELHLSLLTDNPLPFNPGIAGCGLVVANLRNSSLDALYALGKETEALYKGALYENRYEASQVFSPWLWNREE
ncbi:hypothetical protein KJ865_00570, partial [Myxococcota bacterium]|nr:hypothetical protein [Myxococcota bacterium]